MKRAVEEHEALAASQREYRRLERAAAGGDAEAARALPEAKREAEAAEAGYGGLAPWYVFYRLTDFTGRLFLNLLNLLVLPLIVASLVMGLVSLGDIRHLGRTGLRTVVYYMATTAAAVITGLVMVNLFEPGVGVEGAAAVAERVAGKEEAGLIDTVLSVFVDEGDAGAGAVPRNIFAAMAGGNVLGVICFTMLLAAALTTVGERAGPVVAFFDGLNEAVLRLVHWVMYLLPAGIFGLVTARLAAVGGGAAVWGEVTRLAWYAATVLSALLIHALVVLPLVLLFVGGRNPLSYGAGMVQALLTAFSTASSSATLPTTMECVKENNRVSRRSASFVLPLGATINMDGTALYEAVAVVFIAQVYGVEMDFAKLVIVFLTATLAAVGAAGIPEAGLVTMVIVLNATGLPLEGITILLSIDWLLDRCRTTVNVWGDSIGAAVVDRLEESEELKI
ncbi:MAG TPA: dicarboxylate/amino acid:cation symporter [Deltaproteobacteria bacterium]|nr:dicarboxylate/amino acid:cation symporter [Deltaproteobacteria bacterium]